MDNDRELLVRCLVMDEIAKLTTTNNLDEDNFEIEVGYIEECLKLAGQLEEEYESKALQQEEELGISDERKWTTRLKFNADSRGE